MNFNRLHVFNTAARLLNFTKAAEHLHLTQPGISKHLKGLEDECGAKLFERFGKKVFLTQAGEVLYEATNEAFSILDSAKRRIDDLGTLTTGQLAIGATRTIGSYLLPEKLVQYRQRYPGVDIKVETALNSQVVKSVLDGNLDIGLVGYVTQDPRLEARVFMHDTLLLVVSPLHPWSKRKSPVHLSELNRQTLLVSKRGSGTWRSIEALLDAADVHSCELMELGTTEGVKQATMANLGVSLLSGHVLSGELASGAIKQVPIASGDLARDLYLIQRKDRYLSQAANAFVKLL